MFILDGVMSKSIGNNYVPMNAFTGEVYMFTIFLLHISLFIFKEHIFDASMEFHVQHGLNSIYDQELEVSNIILMDCILERFAEAKGAKLTKVGFKLLGIGFIKKGFPSSSDMWSITTSPSK